jgi:hypothetical protein
MNKNGTGEQPGTEMAIVKKLVNLQTRLSQDCI